MSDIIQYLFKWVFSYGFVKKHVVSPKILEPILLDQMTHELKKVLKINDFWSKVKVKSK